ncbi:MAG: 50S ribosomal protein L25 [Candidatus Paceibacterota bacterium]
MTKNTFQVQKRATQKPKELRRAGIIPANIFGGGDSIAIQINTLNFEKLYEQVGETGLVYFEIEGDTAQHPVLVEEVQKDPVSGELLHVSLKQVNLTEKIEAEVPVETIGEFDVAQGVLVVVKDQIEVEALPADFPEKFEIDVSTLTEIGQMVTYADLKYDKSKVRLILGEEGEEEPVVLVQEQRAEEPVEEPEAVEGEGEEAVAGEEAKEVDGEKGEEAKEKEGDKKPEEDKKAG